MTYFLICLVFIHFSKNLFGYAIMRYQIQDNDLSFEILKKH